MKIFIYDGTAEGFFTAVFDGFKSECIITSDCDVQLSMCDEIIPIRSDIEKSGRVIRAITMCDNEAVGDIGLVLRSADSLKEKAAFGYIKRLLERKSPIKKAFGLAEVIGFNEILYKVTGEIHRMKGFLRFIECAGGALYAPYRPDNDITDLLMPHFAARLMSEKFVIHDVKRKIAGVYDGSAWMTCEAGEAEIYLSEYERAFENLWKKYYASVNIAERPHEKQMRGSMPARYWKYMPEKKS